ncbi:PCI domain-containing protein [Plasmodiophora brassicae]
MEALERACIMASTGDVRGQGLAHVVMDSLKQPGLYTFDRLLRVRQIDEMKHSAEYLPVHNALRLFAYGTYSDYRDNRSTPLPDLSPAHILKLKALTVLSYASRCKRIRYGDLMQELDIDNVRDLEDLVISCIYDGSLHAKLDQTESCVDILKVESRDVAAGELPEMVAQLKTWTKSSKDLANSIGNMADAIERHEAQRREHAERVQKHLKLAEEDYIESVSKKQGPHESAMMVDDDSDPGFRYAMQESLRMR